MVVDETLLNGAVEAFTMGVHFRRPRIGPPVGDVMAFEFAFEVFHKLRAVVGQQVADRHRSQSDKGAQGVCGAGAAAGGGSPGEGEARAGGDEGEDIASDAIADALYGIASEQFHGGGGDALGAACLADLTQWLVPSAAIQAGRGASCRVHGR